MKRMFFTVFCAASLVTPLFSGALVLQISNPASNQEAKDKHAVLLAHLSACRSPEKTTVTAEAEGIVNGVRKTLPLQLIRLSTPGLFGVERQWPDHGKWVIMITAKNPDYGDYAPSAMVLAENDSVNWAAIKNYPHVPTTDEVAAFLGINSISSTRR
jgi:hypothetical protein